MSTFNNHVRSRKYNNFKPNFRSKAHKQGYRSFAPGSFFVKHRRPWQRDVNVENNSLAQDYLRGDILNLIRRKERNQEALFGSRRQHSITYLPEDFLARSKPSTSFYEKLCIDRPNETLVTLDRTADFQPKDASTPRPVSFSQPVPVDLVAIGNKPQEKEDWEFFSQVPGPHESDFFKPSYSKSKPELPGRSRPWEEIKANFDEGVFRRPASRRPRKVSEWISKQRKYFSQDYPHQPGLEEQQYSIGPRSQPVKPVAPEPSFQRPLPDPEVFKKFERGTRQTWEDDCRKMAQVVEEAASDAFRVWFPETSEDLEVVTETVPKAKKRSYMEPFFLQAPRTYPRDLLVTESETDLEATVSSLFEPPSLPLFTSIAWLANFTFSS